MPVLYLIILPFILIIPNVLFLLKRRHYAFETLKKIKDQSNGEEKDADGVNENKW